MSFYLEEIEKVKAQIDRYTNDANFNKITEIFNKWNDVNLTYTSNALEGNTLTSVETSIILEKGTTIANKTIVEHLEVENHYKAIQYIKDNIGIKINYLGIKNLILTIHRILLDRINNDISGNLRNVPVRIAGSNSILPNYLKVPDLMEEMYYWIIENINIIHPINLALEVHLRLVSIHPFEDGNGRTARLLMNFILLKFGYTLTSIEVENRTKYLTSLEKIQCGGSNDDYQEIMCYSVLQSMRSYLNLLEE